MYYVSRRKSVFVELFSDYPRVFIEMVRCILLLTLAFLAITLAIPTDDPHANKWKEFKEKHGKKYKDDQEEEKRFKIFSDNQEKIDAHNKRFQEGTETYQVGMQEFGDLTEEEFTKTHKGLDAKKIPLPQSKREAEPYLNVALRDLPASVDWRPLKYVSPVQDQKYCGSCWTFSATGAVEGLIARVIGPDHLTHAIDTSEQQLLDCVYPGQDTCNTGGIYTDAWTYIQKKQSLYETSYPYIGAYSGVCKNATGYAQKGLVRGQTCLPMGNESALQQAVATIGPVSVAIDSSGLFNYYTGGVYYNPVCNPQNLDHAVLVVGYGTDPDGGDYYIVKNSWGTAVGIQGYWQMARNKDNNCGIATYACYPYFTA